jgi:hypothetical protein
MRTRMTRLSVPAAASGVAVFGGVTLWRLGIEFERAWLRSYDGPLTGDPIGHDRLLGRPYQETDRSGSGIGEHRRWVAARHPGASARVARAT